MKNSIIILSTIAVLAFGSCKSTRTIVKTEVKTENEVVLLIEKIKKTQARFNTANVSKLSLELKLNERVVNVSANCKIRQDSTIYLSIQPFMGIEMFKVELTTDVIVIVDKMNRKFYRTDYNYLSEKLGMNINYQNLQALLLGNFFCVGSEGLLPDSCKLLNERTIIFENGSLTQHTETDPSNLIQKVLLKDRIKGYELQTDYSGYTVIKGVNFPQKIEINAVTDKTKANCTLSILKVDFNTEIIFVPSNPDRYSSGNIEQLLKK